MSLKFAFIADSARNWLNHLLKKFLIWSRKLRIICFACALYWIFLIFERQIQRVFATATFLKLIRSKSEISSSILIFMRRMITTSRSYAILLYVILVLSLSLWGLENFLLLWFCLIGDVSEDCGPGKKRRMLRDNILTAERRISSFSEHETKRSAENEEVFDNQKNIKMISQRHETNEKQDETISSWARSERKESVWIFLFCIRKEKAMLSVVVNSAWDSELISTMMKM